MFQPRPTLDCAADDQIIAEWHAERQETAMTHHWRTPRIADAPATWADTLPRGTSEWTAPDCDDIAIPPVEFGAIRTRLRREYDRRVTWREQWTGAMAVVAVVLLLVAALVVLPA